MRDLALPGLAVAISLLLGYLSTLSGGSPSGILIVLISITLFAPLALRRRDARLSWLEPIVWVNLSLALMFVLRPLARTLSGEYGYMGYDLSSGFVATLVTAWIGVAAFNIGYLAAPLTASVHRLPRLRSEVRDSSAVVFSFFLLGFALIAYAYVAVRNGASIADVFSTGFVQNPGTTSAYLYLAPLALLPAALLLFSTGLRRGSGTLSVTAVVLVTIVLAITAPSGSRFTSLMFILPFGIYLALKFNLMPRLVPTAAIVALIFAFVIATQDFQPGVNDSSDVVSSTFGALAHPVGSIKSFALSPTVEMFDGMVLEHRVMDSQLAQRHGVFLLTAATHPIPRMLWPNKPYPPDGVLAQTIFASNGVTSSDNSVAFSIMGGMYFDSGRIGVLIAMLGLGLLLRWSWVYLMANRDNEATILTYSLFLPLVLVLVRGSLPDTFGRALFTLVPIPVFFWAAARRRSASPQPSRQTSAVVPVGVR